MTELSLVTSQLKDMDFEDPQYPALRSRENIIHQFETIKLKGELLRLNPWNFNFGVNDEENVVLLFATSWCEECQKLIVDMVRVEGPYK